MATVIGFLVGLLVGGVLVGISIYAMLESKRRTVAEDRSRVAGQEEILARRSAELVTKEAQIHEQQARAREFNAQVIQYNELKDENLILRTDLRNISISVRKAELDSLKLAESQQAIHRRASELAERFLKENVKWVSSSLNPTNFAASKERLLKVIAWCRDVGYAIDEAREAELVQSLKTEYEGVLRAAFAREEQARIRAQIREEQAREREIERELKRLENERAAIRAALDQALAEAMGEQTAEIEQLRIRLAEAEQSAQRAISQAQITKSGHVYVISNIGSFGEGVFKIGMTRRLVPLDRVRELSGAAVPFPFDVHMMIASDDAPTLENALHRALHKSRLNKANPRKEYFRVSIENIQQIVTENHGKVEYMAEPEALQYYQSLSMSVEDQEFIEQVYENFDDIEDEAEVTQSDE